MKKIFYTCLSALLILSCQKVEKIEKIGSITPKLIVSCVAMDGEKFEFHVTKSLSALDNAPQRILKNTTILLYDNGVLAETIKYNGLSGKYLTDTTHAKMGHKYNFTATSPGLGAVSAEMVVIAPVAIDDAKLTVEGLEKSNSGGIGSYFMYNYKSAKMSVSFKDKAGEKNYYLLVMNEEWLSGVPNGGYNYDEFNWTTLFPGTEAIQTDSPIPYFFIKDDFSDGKTMNIDITHGTANIYARSSSDSLLGYNIQLFALSEDYFKHYYTLQLYLQNVDNIGSEQPTQIFYNIKGGYGIFGSKAVSEFYVPFPY